MASLRLSCRHLALVLDHHGLYKSHASSTLVQPLQPIILIVPYYPNPFDDPVISLLWLLALQSCLEGLIHYWHTLLPPLFLNQLSSMRWIWRLLPVMPSRIMVVAASSHLLLSTAFSLSYGWRIMVPRSSCFLYHSESTHKYKHYELHYSALHSTNNYLNWGTQFIAFFYPPQLAWICWWVDSTPINGYLQCKWGISDKSIVLSTGSGWSYVKV